MTLLEILVVLAIITIVMGFFIGPRILAMFGESKVTSAGILVKKYAHEAYTRWQLKNPGEACPESLEELGKLIDQETTDPWGSELVMMCGENAPPEANGFGVLSLGEDRQRDTDDDITSWKTPKQKE